MLPSGELVVARADSSAARDQELFWAVRGGTGNQFGVLLEVVYQLVPLKDVWGFAIVWDATKAAAALDVLQRKWMRGKTSKQLGFQVALASVKAQPQLAMIGMWNGSETTGRAGLDPLVTATGGSYFHSRVGTYAFLNQWLLDDTLDPPTGDIVELKKAGYLANQLGVAGWQKVVDAFLKAPNKFGLAIIEAYGGRIAEIPADASAFVHRAVDGDFFVDSFFDASGSPTSQAQAQQWLDAIMTAVAPGLNGEVYQNYPSRGLANYKTAYWGSAVKRLETLKKEVDPTGLLDFEQTV
jgi:FAD/FMN-containing dehydrogenase